jgi:hypothetical protein
LPRPSTFTVGFLIDPPSTSVRADSIEVKSLKLRNRAIGTVHLGEIGPFAFITIPIGIDAANDRLFAWELRSERFGLLVKCRGKVIASPILSKGLIFVPEVVEIGIEPA